MEHADERWCYGCGERIGLLRSVLTPVVATFESAFDGPVRAAFCSPQCEADAIERAAAAQNRVAVPAATDDQLPPSATEKPA